MSKVLYVGFKGKNNSSCQLITRMSGDKAFLTNSYSGIVRDIGRLDKSYDRIIMFGLDKRLKREIRFELSSRRSEEVSFSSMDISVYTDRASYCKIKFSVSDKPTEYLCNYAYFEMMKFAQCPVIFVHIPGIRNISDDFMEKLVTLFK